MAATTSSRSSRNDFRIEYRNAAGVIANYIPDFIVKRTDAEIWIVETKGREDLTDIAKWERLQQWCADGSAHHAARSFHPLFVRKEHWNSHSLRTFSQLARISHREGCIGPRNLR